MRALNRPLRTYDDHAARTEPLTEPETVTEYYERLRVQRIRRTILAGAIMLAGVVLLTWSYANAQDVTRRSDGSRVLMLCRPDTPEALSTCRRVNATTADGRFRNRRDCSAAATEWNARRDARIDAGQPAGDVAYCVVPRPGE